MVSLVFYSNSNVFAIVKTTEIYKKERENLLVRKNENVLIVCAEKKM